MALASRRDQARRAGDQRDRALRRAQITRRRGFGQVVSRSGVNDLARVRLPQRVANPRHFQIERMVAGKRQQIETERRQRIERFRRGEKSPALGNRLAFFGDRGFQVGENHIALQQPLDHRHRRRRGRAQIRPDHRLPRQRNREHIGLCPHAIPDHAQHHQ